MDSMRYVGWIADEDENGFNGIDWIDGCIGGLVGDGLWIWVCKWSYGFTFIDVSQWVET
jgi:hypothetical protein